MLFCAPLARLLRIFAVANLVFAPASAMAVFEDAKITASDGEEFDAFGFSVSIFGDTAVIGAPGDDDNEADSGSAYVYRYNGSDWVEEGPKLTASDGEADDLFGFSVSIAGDKAVIGAYGDSDDGQSSGSAYVFRYNGNAWVEDEKLTASDAAAFDLFGYSVSISGNAIVVGAHGDSDDGPASGSAYVFRYDGNSWVEEEKLTAYDGAEADRFGRSVSISGNKVLVGAFADNDDGANSGSAYVFRYNGNAWVEDEKLTASDGAAVDQFGGSVSISGNTAVIGAANDDDNGSDSGSAYVFRFDGDNWVEEEKLTPSDGAEADRFGISVSISANSVVVGAEMDDDAGSSSGSAYVFTNDGGGWQEETKLTASDGMQFATFGGSVSIFADTAVVATIGDDENGELSGSAYVFGEVVAVPSLTPLAIVLLGTLMGAAGARRVPGLP